MHLDIGLNEDVYRLKEEDVRTEVPGTVRLNGTLTTGAIRFYINVRWPHSTCD